MILFKASRDGDGNLIGFTVKNHGRSDVCAAVSLFVLNTVNSIEALTNEPFKCDYKEEGGFIDFKLTEPPAGKEAKLLLDSMTLALNGLKEQYPTEVHLNTSLRRA